MTYGILFEKITNGELPEGYYYAHVPTLGLTTHGVGVEGARSAARELIGLWIDEKKAHGEAVPETSDLLFSTVDVG